MRPTSCRRRITHTNAVSARVVRTRLIPQNCATGIIPSFVDLRGEKKRSNDRVANRPSLSVIPAARVASGERSSDNVPAGCPQPDVRGHDFQTKPRSKALPAKLNHSLKSPGQLTTRTESDSSERQSKIISPLVPYAGEPQGLLLTKAVDISGPSR